MTEQTSEEAKKSKRQITVVVNAQKKVVHGTTLSFEQIVALAYENPPTGENVIFEVTYRKGPSPKQLGAGIGISAQPEVFKLGAFRMGSVLLAKPVAAAIGVDLHPVVLKLAQVFQIGEAVAVCSDHLHGLVRVLGGPQGFFKLLAQRCGSQSDGCQQEQQDEVSSHGLFDQQHPARRRGGLFEAIKIYPGRQFGRGLPFDPVGAGDEVLGRCFRYEAPFGIENLDAGRD